MERDRLKDKSNKWIKKLSETVLREEVVLRFLFGLSFKEGFWG